MSCLKCSVWSAIALTGFVITACGCSQDATTPDGGPNGPRTSTSSPDSTTSTLDVEIGPTGEGWGNIVVTFQYGGDAPEPALIPVTKDVEFCGPREPREESLLVNPENKGIANVFMWLRIKSTDDAPPIHESYAESAEAEVKLDNHGCSFSPHAILLRTSQSLVIGNSDEVGHNSKFDPQGNPVFNSMISPGTEKTAPQLTRPTRTPFAVTCSIHTWMKGYVMLQDHPYMALSDENGELRIENLPAGNWEFITWHEKPGYVDEVTRDGKAQTWRLGRVTATIEPDQDTSLGTVVIVPD